MLALLEKLKALSRSLSTLPIIEPKEEKEEEEEEEEEEELKVLSDFVGILIHWYYEEDDFVFFIVAQSSGITVQLVVKEESVRVK